MNDLEVNKEEFRGISVSKPMHKLTVTSHLESIKQEKQPPD